MDNLNKFHNFQSKDRVIMMKETCFILLDKYLALKWQHLAHDAEADFEGLHHCTAMWHTSLGLPISTGCPINVI